MGAVFVSYRRDDSAGQARALSMELAQLIGKDSVFIDVDNIALGLDFRQAIHERLESCDCLLALIGPDWIDAKDASGRRRLDSPSDFVRLEIAAALKRDIPVTPVLVHGAQMPQQELLPDDLKDLVFRNGFPLRHETWESDVTELVRRLGLKRIAADQPPLAPTLVSPSPTPAPPTAAPDPPQAAPAPPRAAPAPAAAAPLSRETPEGLGRRVRSAWTRHPAATVVLIAAIALSFAAPVFGGLIFAGLLVFVVARGLFASQA